MSKVELRIGSFECAEGRGTLKLSCSKQWVKRLTLIKLSAFAEYALRTILGSDEEKGRIRDLILAYMFVA